MGLGIFCILLLLAILVYIDLNKEYREQELKKQRLEEEARNRESEQRQKTQKLMNEYQRSVDALANFEKYESKRYLIEKDSKLLKIYDRHKNEIFSDKAGYEEEISDYSVSPDEKYIAIGITDIDREIYGGTGFLYLYLYDIETGKKSEIEHTMMHGIESVIFSTDGKYIKVKPYMMPDVVWDFQTGKIVRKFDFKNR